MRKSLITELRKNSDVDFFELQKMIGIASNLRCIMREYNQSLENVAEELEVSQKEVKDILSAGYNGDLRLIAKIDVYWHRLEIQKIQEKSIAIISKSE